MWYVIQVKTGDEKKVVCVCEKAIPEDEEYTFFIPESDRMKKYHGEWHKVRKPMFPGYVFLESDSIETVYEQLKKIQMLTKVLKTDTSITAISPKEEQMIKSLTDEAYVAEMSMGYIEGDKLTVSEGPLVGKEGLVKRIDRHKRIAILEMEMLGGLLEVEVGLEVLSKD